MTMQLEVIDSVPRDLMPINMADQRYAEITHARPPSVYRCTRNILTFHRETLTQYITFKRGGRGESTYSCTLVVSQL
jgi:hypothetical protein